MTPSAMHHAPPPPHRLRKTIVRLVIPALSVMTVLLLGKACLPYLRQAQYLLLQNRCMNHEVPTTTIVYSEDPGDVAKLASTPDYHLYEWPPSPSPADSVTPVVRDDRIDQDLRWSSSAHPLFLHHRRSPGGHDRLVGVGCSLSATSESHRYIALCYSTGTPATWRPGSIVDQASFIPVGFDVLPGERLRLYAAQPDAADPSHFVMKYEINVASGVIDGWLLDNGRLRFEIASGPAVGRLRRY